MKKQYHTELYDLFTKISTAGDAKKILKDILTPAELDAIAERWQLIKLLHKGVSQREIAKKLNISISKITRDSRALKYGTGGFKILLENET